MVRTAQPFLFVAGAPPLDFVNTEIVVNGEPVDLLADDGDLTRWLGQSGLATPARLRTMRSSSLAAVKELRAHLRRIFLRLAAGEVLRGADLAPLNDALESVATHLRLGLRDGRPHLQIEPRKGATPAFLIARGVAEFLATADLSLIRQCEGSGCILLFYDTTKSHTRRWCSMAACGNRSKAAAHYHRNR